MESATIKDQVRGLWERANPTVLTKEEKHRAVMELGVLMIKARENCGDDDKAFGAWLESQGIIEAIQDASTKELQASSIRTKLLGYRKLALFGEDCVYIGPSKVISHLMAESGKSIELKKSVKEYALEKFAECTTEEERIELGKLISGYCDCITKGKPFVLGQPLEQPSIEDIEHANETIQKQYDALKGVHTNIVTENVHLKAELAEQKATVSELLAQIQALKATARFSSEKTQDIEPPAKDQIATPDLEEETTSNDNGELLEVNSNVVGYCHSADELLNLGDKPFLYEQLIALQSPEHLEYAAQWFDVELSTMTYTLIGDSYEDLIDRYGSMHYVPSDAICNALEVVKDNLRAKLKANKSIINK